MIEAAATVMSDALGLALEAHDLSATQMALRAAIVFIILLGIMRIVDRRFSGRARRSM